MLQRIVKLTIATNEVDKFIKMFEASKPKILDFGGCQQVSLLRANSPSNVLFTYSYWADEEALEMYRSSDLFRGIWIQVKPLFAEKAQAWSIKKIA